MAGLTALHQRYQRWPHYLQQITLGLVMITSLELVLLYGHRTETVNAYLTSYTRSLTWLNLLVMACLANSERRLRASLLSLAFCLVITLAVYAGFSSIVLGEVN